LERKKLSTDEVSVDANLPFYEIMEDYISKINEYSSINQIEADVLHRLLHLDMNAAWIKENKNYLPLPEIESIFQLFHSISLEKTSTVKDHFIAELASHLIILGDILLQRMQEEDALDYLEKMDIIEKITITISSLNDSIFNKIQVPRDNLVSRHIEEKLQKPLSIPLSSSVHPITYFDSMTALYGAAKEPIKVARDFFSTSRNEEELKKCLSDDKSFLKDLIECHMTGNLVPADGFLNVLQWLQEQFTDKEAFALLILKNYKMIFNKLKTIAMREQRENPSFLFASGYLEGSENEVRIAERILLQVFSVINSALGPTNLKKIFELSDQDKQVKPLAQLLVRQIPYNFNIVMLVQCGIFPYLQENLSKLKKIVDTAPPNDTLAFALSMLPQHIDELKLTSSQPLIPTQFVRKSKSEIAEAYEALRLQAYEKNNKKNPEDKSKVDIFFENYENLILELAKHFGMNIIEILQDSLKKSDLNTLAKQLKTFNKFDIRKELLIHYSGQISKSYSHLYALKVDLTLVNFLKNFPHTRYSEPVIEALRKLIDRFYKINDKVAIEFHHRECLDFLNLYKGQIFLLINLGSEKILKEMMDLMGNTAIPLERKLQSVPIGFHHALIQTLSTYFASYPTSLAIILDSIIILNALIQVNAHEKSNLSLVDFYMEYAKNVSPKDFLKKIQLLMLSQFFQEEKIMLTPEDVNKIFERFSLDQCSKLIVASQKMEKNEYRKIFIELLQLDLLGGNVDTFLHDIKQENPIGRDLANHNYLIQEKLRLKKISPDKALRYEKKHDFLLYSGKNKDLILASHYLALWEHLTKLKEVLDQGLDLQTLKVDIRSEKENIKELKLQGLDDKIQKKPKLLRNIDDFFKTIPEINKNIPISENKNIIALLSKDIFKLKSIQRICKFYLKDKLDIQKQDAVFLSKAFYEAAENFNKELEQIITLTSSSKKKTVNAEVDFFSIEQWGKDKMTTFFLGDKVSCCLATDNTDFPAMVQRRMDDAILFHVMIDKSKDQPIALIWLFLAEDLHDNIVLVANFFEVSAEYAQDKNVRRAILNELLEFTHQYMRDNPRITNFYMRKLNYGYNEGDIRSYPIVPFILQDKLGGPFIPLKDKLKASSDAILPDQKSMTVEKYFLDALRYDEFHQFDPAILQKEKRDNVLSTKDLIQSAVAEILKTERHIDKVIALLIEKHRYELEPFYDLPLKGNPNLTKDVTAAYKKVVAGHIKDAKPFVAARLYSGIFLGADAQIKQHKDLKAYKKPR